MGKIGYLGKFLLRKSCEVLEHFSLRSGRVTILGDVQEMRSCGTEGQLVPQLMRVSGHGGGGLTFGLDDLKGLFQP